MTNVDFFSEEELLGISEPALDELLFKLSQKLSDRQRLFGDYLVAGHSQADAYRQAGYAAKGGSAKSAAGRLVRHRYVAAYVDILREQSRRNSGVTQEAMLRRFMDAGDQALRKGDYSAARGHWREAALLADLYPVKRKQIELNNVDVIDATAMSDDAWLTLFELRREEGKRRLQ